MHLMVQIALRIYYNVMLTNYIVQNRNQNNKHISVTTSAGLAQVADYAVKIEILHSLHSKVHAHFLLNMEMREIRFNSNFT